MLVLHRGVRRWLWPGVGALVLLLVAFRLLQRLPSPGSGPESVAPRAGLVIPAHGGETTTPTGVPKVIHQTWKNFEIPTMMEKWARSWVEKNPGWSYWFWRDEDIDHFIHMRFPAHYDLFTSYPNKAYRADAFRYFVLLEHGGVYADLDMEAVLALDDILARHSCLLSQEPHEHAHFLSPMGIPLVSNALMACRPGHPFFEHLVGDLNDYAGLFKWNDVLKATGPYMLTEVYRGYSRAGLIWSAPVGEDRVNLTEPEVFHPITDPSMRDHMRQSCIHSGGHSFLSASYLETQQRLCNRILKQGFQEGPAEESVSVHHWTHTWAGRRNDPYGIMEDPRTFDVRSMRNSREG